MPEGDRRDRERVKQRPGREGEKVRRRQKNTGRREEKESSGWGKGSESTGRPALLAHPRFRAVVLLPVPRPRLSLSRSLRLFVSLRSACSRPRLTAPIICRGYVRNELRNQEEPRTGGGRKDHALGAQLRALGKESDFLRSTLTPRQRAD